MQTLSANKVLALMGVDANTAATGFQFHEVGSNPYPAFADRRVSFSLVLHSGNNCAFIFS
jgi:hypothetical protein